VGELHNALTPGYLQFIGLEAEARSLERFPNHPVARSLAGRGLHAHTRSSESYEAWRAGSPAAHREADRLA